MAREIPEPVRAAAGLAATVLDEARRLPATLPGLPVRVLGAAMQLSMKLQQHYAGLVARGDELLTGIRGEDEPGLATFDDDELPAGVPAPSAFDRVSETVIEVLEEEEEAAETALADLAIEELVDEAPSPAEVVEESARGVDADGLEEAAALAGSPAGAIDVDVLTPEGGIETVQAAVTDEGIAAPEEPTTEAEAPASTGGPALDTATPEPATAEPTETTEAGTEAAGTGTTTAPSGPPIDGYDTWSVAQLRGRLRGFQAVTVSELLAYEEANRAREPYLRMLRNRLEKLDEQAVESSPLAPRGM